MRAFLSFTLLVLLLSFESNVAAANDCFDEMKAQVQAEFRQTSLQYLEVDPIHGQIRKDNEARIHVGKNGKAVVLVHGYAGSPFEVNAVAEKFQALGYTTIQPLIWGFGSSEEVANISNSSQWRTSLSNAVNAVSECVSQVTLVGFSLGGALVTDFVFNNPNLNLSTGAYRAPSGAKAQISKIILAAPFYGLHYHIPVVLLDLIQSTLPAVDAADLYEKTRISDLRVFSAFPQFYNVQMPLSAARNVVQFGQELVLRTQSVSQIPVLFGFSESDLTVDTEMAEKFIGEHLPNSQKFVFAKELSLPHQFLIPEFNPKLNLFLGEIKKFLHGDSRFEMLFDGRPL